MLTKAIIENIENDGTQARVRIPVMHKIDNTAGSTPYSELPIAPICYAPGCKPLLKKGDVVYVEFENNNTSNPVILGQLLLSTNDSSSNINALSLNVTVDTTLSGETTIGEVKPKNIDHLKYSKSNIQGQLDNLSERITVNGSDMKEYVDTHDAILNDKIDDEVETINQDISTLRTNLNTTNQNLNTTNNNLSKTNTCLLENYNWKWRWECYDSTALNETTADTFLETLAQMTPKKIYFIEDRNTSTSLNLADNYTAKCTTYIYFDAATTLTMKLTTDDKGAFWINDVLQLNSSSQKTTTSTSASTYNNCSFNEGWNKITVCYTEGTGGDGWVFETKFWAVADIKKMNCCGGII